MTGRHFYTTNPAEKRAALARGYRDETADTAPVYVFPRPVLHSGIRTVPVHRLYNATTGGRFYTPERAEALYAVRKGGCTDEDRLDSVWLPPPTSPAAPDSTAWLRLWHPGTDDHLYTRDHAEARTAEKAGYRPRRNGVLALSAPAMAEGIVAVRLHRLHRP